MRLLVRINRAGYISLIKKYPNGLPNRLQHFDTWVASWKDPHIRTYHDYFLNGQTRLHEMYMPNCSKAKQVVATLDYNFRPGLAEMHRTFSPIDQNFADDLQLSQDIREVTLRSTMKGFTKKQTRTDVQRVLVWFVTAVISLCVYFYLTVYLQDEQQDVIQMEGHPTYYHYQANRMRQKVESAIQKINFLNAHSQTVLKEAKEKAVQRSLHAGQRQ